MWGCCLAMLPSLIMAAEPTTSATTSFATGRTRLAVLRKGQETAFTGRIPDIALTDRVIVLLIGSGTARLTVTDLGAPGDTVQVVGEVVSTTTSTFTEQAQSPAAIEKPLLISGYGLLFLTINYVDVSNSPPYDYAVTLRF
jgi:hypothetical protein